MKAPRYAEANDMRLEVGEVVDRYRVEGVLGWGALAEVYRVRHLELGLERALKLITRDSPGVLERAIQEGRVQSMLKHEGIVSVVDVFRVRGAPALLMELVDGPSLELLLRQYQPSMPQADALARAMIEGLAHAHAVGLIHRDLKPANILVAVERNRVIPRISDFGLARVCVTTNDTPASPRLTRQGAMMGTPAYMAPEQYSDASTVDARADLFAMGAVLYELVTGVMAFPQVDAMGCYRAIAGSSWRPVRELVPSAPERMVRAIEGALRPEAGERIASAEQLLSVWIGASEGKVVPLPADSSEIWELSHLALIRALAPPLARVQNDTVAEERGSVAPTPEMSRVPFAGGETFPRIDTLPPPVSSRPPGRGPASDPSGASSPVTTGEPKEPDESDEPVQPRRGRRLLVGGLLGLGVCTLLLIGAWLGTRGGSTAPPDSAAQVANAASTEDPAPTEPVSVAAASTPAEGSATTPAPAPVGMTAPSPRGSARASSASSAPSAGAPAASTAAPEVAETSPPAEVEPAPSSPREPAENVTVSGVSKAYLIASDGTRFRPGNVPAGHYTLSVFFEPTAPTPMMELDVKPGKTYAIRCEPALRVCR